MRKLMQKGQKYLQEDNSWGKKATACVFTSNAAFEKARKALGLKPGEVTAVDAPAPKGKTTAAAKGGKSRKQPVA